ncbi:hypothetical protein [Synechococcus sp. H60.4]
MLCPLVRLTPKKLGNADPSFQVQARTPPKSELAAPEEEAGYHSGRYP